MILRLSPREKKYLIVLAIFLLTVIWSQVFWVRQIPKYRFLKAQVALAAEQKSNILTQIDKEHDRDSLLAQMEQEILRLHRKFQSSLLDGSPYILIGNQAQDLVEIKSIYPQELIQKEHYLILPLEIEVQGDYLNLTKFIESLENLPQLFTEIESLGLAATEKEQGEIEASLMLNLYGLSGAGPPFSDYRLKNFSRNFEPFLNRPPENIADYQVVDQWLSQIAGQDASPVTERAPGDRPLEPYRFPER